METFVKALAIMACVGTFFIFKSVNGDDGGIEILSSDGSYKPGSVLAWNGKIDQMRKYTDPEGLEYLQMWQNQNYPVDKALRNGDLKSVAKLARETVPYMKKLIPHVNNENLQKYLKNAIVRGEKFIETLEADDTNMWTLHNFFESESKNMSGILGALVGAVVDFVGDVGGLVGDVLDSIIN